MIGTGTPESCTAEAFVAAVAAGGIIVFDCGPDPFTIVLDRPAKVFNDADPDIVIDGGGLVTLDGDGVHAHPLPEHLRPRPALDDAALRRPGPPRASRSRTSPSSTATR